MKIYSITDPAFAPYGKIIEGYDLAPILQALENETPMPEAGTAYVAEEPAIQNLPAANELAMSLFGGTAAQFGWCNGHNTKLNCLEYHRCSEFNLGTEDFILLLALETDICDGKLDTSSVKAFRVPKGVLIEVYATTLHYAPCHADPAKGFKTLVVLSKGTNLPLPAFSPKNAEDRMLRACNKWLLAHPDAAEAKDGAYVGLVGDNLDIAF